MKRPLGILLGIMLAAVATAQARKQGTAAQLKPKSNAEQKGCTDAKAAFIEKFSQLVSTFHEQVELAEVTPRIALAQRVADLQNTALDLKNAAIPPCGVASGNSAVMLGRETTAMMMDLEAELATPNDTTGFSAGTMKSLQSSDGEIEAICKRLTKEKALNIRLRVWKSDANSAAKFEIKRFLVFMKAASSETGSFEARKAAASSAFYSVAAQSFWRTNSDGRQ